jgi:hypothetical protein
MNRGQLAPIYRGRTACPDIFSGSSTKLINKAKFKTVKKPVLTLIISLVFIAPMQAQAEYNSNYKSFFSGSYVQDKNFYLFTVIQKLEETTTLFSEQEFLQRIYQDKMVNAKEIADTFLIQGTIIAEVFKFSDSDIKNVGEWFREASTEQGLSRLSNHLRSSGNYQMWTDKDDDEFLALAWEQAAQGINYIIDAYALGKHGRYPKIDSVSFNVNSSTYQRLLDNICSLIADKESHLFFEPSLTFALHLLHSNNRDEAARFEPLHHIENKQAVDHLSTIDWSAYQYSIILVPGHGPEKEEIGLSPHAKIRCALAVNRYQKGLAPLIVLSGGYVHPFQTKYCEAYEMKKELTEKHGIPERSIFIEPHARHTTTNFRNAARLIYGHSIPSKKPALVTTTKDQSYYITNMGLEKRCMKELGYVPYKLGERINRNDVVFKPVITSMHRDPIDPLDP